MKRRESILRGTPFKNSPRRRGGAEKMQSKSKTFERRGTEEASSAKPRGLTLTRSGDLLIARDRVIGKEQNQCGSARRNNLVSITRQRSFLRMQIGRAHV